MVLTRLQIKFRVLRFLRFKLLKFLQIEKYISAQIEYEQRLLEIEKLVKVGVDVHLKSASWAVFCIEGKADYVRFVKLEAKELRDLQHLVRRFEKLYGEIRIDKPPFISSL